MQEMQNISDKYGTPPALGGEGDGIDERMARAQTPFSSAIGSIKGYEGYDEMLNVIDDNGFGDLTQWAAFGDRVMRAYGAEKMATEAPQVDAQMAEALKQLENSGLSEAQKKMMLEVMGSANHVMESFNDVPADDRAAVRPHINALDNM